jgi:uncharacterized OB-fold protein
MSQRPLPEIGEHNTEFWAALGRGELRLQRCADCRHLRHPVNETCPQCLSGAFAWETVSGRGEVLSTIVFHQVYHQAFADEVPYNVSLIQLDEGPRLISNVLGADPASVAVGDRVEVVFAPIADDVTIHRFRRTGDA